MSETYPPYDIEELKEEIGELLFDDFGKEALRKMFSDNLFLANIFTSDQPIPFFEDFVMATAGLSESKTENRLYEILSEENGPKALKEALIEYAPLSRRLNLIVPGFVPENDECCEWPLTPPWI